MLRAGSNRAPEPPGVEGPDRRPPPCRPGGPWRGRRPPGRPRGRRTLSGSLAGPQAASGGPCSGRPHTAVPVPDRPDRAGASGRSVRDPLPSGGRRGMASPQYSPPSPCRPVAGQAPLAPDPGPRP